MKWKQTISTDELCFSLPPQIKEIAEYVRSMKVYDEPNYQFIEDKIIEIAKTKMLKISRTEEENNFRWKFKPNCQHFHTNENKNEIKRYKLKANTSDAKIKEEILFKSPLLLASKIDSKDKWVIIVLYMIKFILEE